MSAPDALVVCPDCGGADQPGAMRSWRLTFWCFCGSSALPLPLAELERQELREGDAEARRQR